MTSRLGMRTYSPSTKKTTPGEVAKEENQTVNFLLKLNAAASWAGSPTLLRLRPAMPVTRPARPVRRKFGLQEKTNLGVVAGRLGLAPLVDSRERFWASSPPVLTLVTGLEGKRAQVLVFPTGRAPPEQSPQSVDLAREH